MSARFDDDIAAWRRRLREAGRYNDAGDSLEGRVIEEAVRCARRALKAVRRHEEDRGDASYFQGILPRYNARLVENATSNSAFFAEYLRPSRTIVLYSQTIALHDAAFAETGCNLWDACLIHEFYHLLEFNHPGCTRREVKQRLRPERLWPWRSRAIAHVSEIAAHTFTRHALGLARLPEWIVTLNRNM